MKKGRFTLSKAERISNSRHFNRVFKKGRRIKFPEFTIVAAPNGLPFSRMGIGVGRRFGNAVKRNRAKRLCRELFRLNKYQLPKGIDIVFIPHQEILKASWQKLQANMKKAGKIIERNGIIKAGTSKSNCLDIGGNCQGL